MFKIIVNVARIIAFCRPWGCKPANLSDVKGLRSSFT